MCLALIWKKSPKTQPFVVCHSKNRPDLSIGKYSLPETYTKPFMKVILCKS